MPDKEREKQRKEWMKEDLVTFAEIFERDKHWPVLTHAIRSLLTREEELTKELKECDYECHQESIKCEELEWENKKLTELAERVTVDEGKLLHCMRRAWNLMPGTIYINATFVSGVKKLSLKDLIKAIVSEINGEK